MGINSLLQQDMQGAGLAGIDRLAGNAMFPQSQMDKTQYSVSSQMPTSAEVVNAGYEPKNNAYTGMPVQNFAAGGIATLRYDEGGEVDPNAWQAINYSSDPFNPGEDTKTYYMDPKTGDVYDSAPTQASVDDAGNIVDANIPKLVSTADAYRNSDIQGLNIDPIKAQELYDLKSTDPRQYAGEVMGQLSELMKTQYNYNENYEPTWHKFAALQDLNPEAFHRNQLNWLGHQQGWQVGQNTSERNEAGLPVIQNEIEQARKVGLSDEEINQILSGSSQQANYQNQVRIANELASGGSGFNFQKDVLPGLIFVGGSAAAMTGAGAALAAGGAGAAGAAGATGAAGAGAGAGAAAAQSTIPAWLAAAGKGAAIGAGMGGGSAALQGGDVGKGILYGGLTGAVGGGVGSAMGGGYAGNMAGGALAGGTGSALRGGNIAQGAGMGALGGAISTGISGLDAPDAAKYGLNYFGKPLVMSQVGNAIGGNGIPGSTAGTDGGYGISAAPSGTYSAFNPGANTGSGVTGLTGLGVSAPQGTNPFAAQYAIPKIQLSKLSDFEGYAAGGMTHGDGLASLGSYSDGGQLLKGPGDGMSDNIPAKIGNTQPARLADGEFVVPADVVSHLGNGSTDAGAKQLYKMMDKIRHARTGNKKQGKKINPNKYLP